MTTPTPRDIELAKARRWYAHCDDRNGDALEATEDYTPSSWSLVKEPPMPSPSEAAPPYTIRDYDGTGRRWLVHGPTLPELGAMFTDHRLAVEYHGAMNDAWSCGRDAAQVEAAVAAARAEMRERCGWAACPIHEKHPLTEWWRGRRRAANDIRALPLDPEVTK